MPMYNLIECSGNYAKASGSLWQFHKDVPKNPILDSEPFKFKAKTTRGTPAVGNTKGIEIAIPLKYLSNFWGTLKMPLINCKINSI